MAKYFQNINEDLMGYFRTLSPEIPSFLEKYIDTPAMQKQAEISVSCGLYYSKLSDIKFFYSSLDHSVAVALVIWNFTHKKKQTLSGLFHDISTPVFKHCIDFLNGDYEKQESTEELTTSKIQNSKEIMELLKRDNIKLEEVSNYHIYPIADNDTPKLSADRLEYTLSNGLGAKKELWSLDEVKEIYQNIEIQKNEENIEELGFKDIKIAEEFVHIMSKLSNLYIDNRTKLSMQFLADTIKQMNNEKFISKKDLYELSEKDVIEKIKNCSDKNIAEKFKKWQETTIVHESENFVNNKYCKTINAKIRYINPLVKINNSCDKVDNEEFKKYVRINEVSKKAKEDIENCLNYKTIKYAYFDF